MKLSKLLEGLKIKEIIGNKDIDIKDVKTESNSVVKGTLFICLKGGNYDGHSFISQAVKYGAKAVVVEQKQQTDITQIVVENSRAALSVIAGNFYENADKKIKIIGVTGTNGKTTTTHLITSILQSAGIKCGLIGTLGIFYGNRFIEPTLTTPDPLELHRYFYEMYNEGVEVAVMEVSAHALFFDKVYGINFEYVLLTNFTQDHLDFFETMENYKKAKEKLFTCNNYKYAILNSDDNFGKEISSRLTKCITYGIYNPSDVFAIDICQIKDGTNFVLNLFDKIYDINLNLIGEFNVYNALAACTVCALLGVSTDKTAEGLDNLKCVSGRLELVYSGDFDVYTDYAHTPDGLDKSLKALKPYTKNKLICVFGCGGNRDKSKRRIMGEISGRYADFTVITSDNPRFEEPMDIINEIEKGVIDSKGKYVIVMDRTEGIDYAIKKAQTGDVILIAGKGSEKYQEVFGVKHPYNDKDTINEILKSINV